MGEQAVTFCIQRIHCKLPYNKFGGKGNMPKEEAIIRYRQHTTMIIREALH